ncbi:methyltransferase domain-containing protein [Fulvimonas yonginensis]|uniref:Methyltransferase domain-containing protein n=1 Tax=Fulvimonas yonginensis TaxID=1495200 RepID=A0ABU8JE33_9GAMM
MRLSADLPRLAPDPVIGTLDAPGAWRARAELRAGIEARWPEVADGEAIAGLPADVQALWRRLDRADAALHRRLRAAVRAGAGPRLLEHWRAETEAPPGGEGYDALDELVAGVLRSPDPGEVPALPPEMVFYQPTPARHVLDMLLRLNLHAGDVLVDLGAGLGHVPLLAAACTAARAVGIEIAPAYVASARSAARALGLDRAHFLAQDARAADLSTGTVFFLYTPFRGTVLRAMLDALRAEAAHRNLRLCSFGPCTLALADEPWLRTDAPPVADRVALFHAGPAA